MEPGARSEYYRNWFVLGTVFVHFASRLSTGFVCDRNVVLAVLGEELVVPNEFV